MKVSILNLDLWTQADTKRVSWSCLWWLHCSRGTQTTMTHKPELAKHFITFAGSKYDRYAFDMIESSCSKRISWMGGGETSKSLTHKKTKLTQRFENLGASDDGILPMIVFKRIWNIISSSWVEWPMPDWRRMTEPLLLRLLKRPVARKKSFKVCRVQLSFATEVSNSFTGRMLTLESWTLPAWIKVQVIRLPRFICIQITTEKQHVLKVDVERNYLNLWYSYIYCN